MDEVIPGVWDWTTYHDGIGMDVHSHFHAPSGTLIDPRMPEEGLEWFKRAEPRRIVLTNRHHHRHSAEFAQAFGCPVLCHEAGLHAFEGDDRVEGYAFGDELAPGVRALEVGVITPEESALHLEGGVGVLALADCVIDVGDGLAFVPDSLLGDDPAAIRDGLRAALGRLAREVEFDALLLAHGPPRRSGARNELRDFAAG